MPIWHEKTQALFQKRLTSDIVKNTGRTRLKLAPRTIPQDSLNLSIAIWRGDPKIFMPFSGMIP